MIRPMLLEGSVLITLHALSIAGAENLPLLEKPRPSIFDKSVRCQPIDIPLCSGLPYNKTIFPNPYFAGSDEPTLQSQISHFKPLTLTKCNPHIQFFICSAFAPMCPDQMPQAVTSCRSVCEEVRQDCEPILTQFEMQWPSILDCHIFPEENDGGVCMRPPEPSVSRLPEPIEHAAPLGAVKSASPTLLDPIHIVKVLPACPLDMVNLDPTDANGTCAFRCEKDAMFTRERKDQVKLWTSSMATSAMCMSLFIVLSIAIDWERFRFPERCIFYLSLCNLCHPLPYLARWMFTFERSSCSRLPTSESFLIQSGHDNVLCVLSFLPNYYFMMAGTMWWLALTFTWYLSASRKWAHEEIQKRSGTIHVISWGLPALLCIAVLVTHKVDASELHGVCSVGNSNPATHVAFVFLPRIVMLFGGGLLTLIGFCSMANEKRCFKKRGTDTSKLGKFMLKMGTFSGLYVLPLCLIVFCDIYHLSTLLVWYSNTVACKQQGGATNCVRPAQPRPEPYLLGVMLPLLVPVSASVWVLSWKTFCSWARLLCCRRQDKMKFVAYPTNVSPVQFRYTCGAGERLVDQVLLTAGEPTTTFVRHPSVTYSPRGLTTREIPPPPPSLSHSSAPKYNYSGGRALNAEPYSPLRVSTDGASEMICRTYADQWRNTKVV